MTWTDAEAALQAHIEAQWALGSYAAVPLVFGNDNADLPATYMSVEIEGVFAEKTLYGGTGKRSSVEAGIVYFHAFVPTGSGKAAATGAIDAMTTILELQTVSASINLEGGNPPSPVEYGDVDRSVPGRQPGGNYYRCSGSVPFIVLSTR